MNAILFGAAGVLLYAVIRGVVPTTTLSEPAYYVAAALLFMAAHQAKR